MNKKQIKELEEAQQVMKRIQIETNLDRLLEPIELLADILE